MTNPRYKKITSSTISSIFGVNPYQTALEAQLKILSPEEEPATSGAIDRGNALEGPVAAWLGGKLGIEWIKAPRRDHPKYDQFSDSVDFIHILDDGHAWLCEAKTASGRLASEWGEEGTDEIPRHYLLQCYWHLLHWPEAVRCYVPVLIGGFEFEFRCYVVERDNSILANVERYALAWHQKHIVDMVPVGASSRDEDALKRMFPPKNDRDKDLIDDDESETATMVRRYKFLDGEIKKLTDEKDGIKNRLCQKIGPHRGIRGSWGQATWSDRKGQVSWSKLVDDHFKHLITDEMKERYQSHYRVFAVKENSNQ